MTQAPHPVPPGDHRDTRPLSTSDERLWAILAHLGPLVVAAVTVGTLGFLAPLVIWLVLRDRSALVADQAKEALNFQITVAVVSVALWALGLFFGWIPFLGGLVTGLVTAVGILVWIVTVVLAVIAAVTVGRNDLYRYPFTLRLVK
ncbi:DUF4870 domain-containing protein [Isoptericola jiangsuensis]|uniref:DUF4870 domain-containing protein n=1 Tax=Isoptericola jiangsuensis TaxID=548579 RepID=UPI003AAB876A